MAIKQQVKCHADRNRVHHLSPTDKRQVSGPKDQQTHTEPLTRLLFLMLTEQGPFNPTSEWTSLSDSGELFTQKPPRSTPTSPPTES